MSTSLSERPWISIITPSLNSGEWLERNLLSVSSQGISEDQLEHWVIDGASDDKTLSILRQSSSVRWVSEPDRGLAHAVNKGIELSCGEWIIWLNADDVLAPEALLNFREVLRQDTETKIFCGDQIMYFYDGRPPRLNCGWPYNRRELLGLRTGIVQASTFVHREVYDRVGLLDENYHHAMDYEWVVRAVGMYPCRHIPLVLTHYFWRKGSIMQSKMMGFHQDFLKVRRAMKCSHWQVAELYNRLYLAMEPLRRIRWLRRLVRKIKAYIGVEVVHPMD